MFRLPIMRKGKLVYVASPFAKSKKKAYVRRFDEFPFRKLRCLEQNERPGISAIGSSSRRGHRRSLAAVQTNKLLPGAISREFQPRILPRERPHRALFGCLDP